MTAAFKIALYIVVIGSGLFGLFMGLYLFFRHIL